MSKQTHGPRLSRVALAITMAFGLAATSLAGLEVHPAFAQASGHTTGARPTFSEDMTVYGYETPRAEPVPFESSPRASGGNGGTNSGATGGTSPPRPPRPTPSPPADWVVTVRTCPPWPMMSCITMDFTNTYEWRQCLLEPRGHPYGEVGHRSVKVGCRHY